MSQTIHKPVTELRHTPGPWRFGQMCGQFCLYAPHSGMLLILDAVRSGMQRAEFRVAIRGGCEGGLMSKVSELESAETHPDLRLIAAAPELLAALQASERVLGAIAEQHGLIQDELDILTDARAAIAKATARE